MKILFVTHTAGKYGASRSLLGLLEGLTLKGVTGYVIMPSKGPLQQKLDAMGIEHEVIAFKWWVSNQRNPIKRILRAISHHIVAYRIARMARNWGADMIHTNGSVTPVGALAAKTAKIPHIWHIREYGEEDYGLIYDYGFSRSAKKMARLSYRLIIISKALAKKYQPYIAPEKFEIIYNPVTIDPSSYTNSSYPDNKPLQLVTIGYLHPAKGIEDAILALSELLKRGRSVSLNIIGDGSPAYVNSLKQLARQHHAEEHVSFLGYLDNPNSTLQMANILLVCSRSEAFGRVTVEGMLHRKPIIAARAGASIELITEGTNGLLYTAGDSQDLADAIEYLINHPQVALEMGEHGFQFASKSFTAKKHIDAMYKIFCAAHNTLQPSYKE
jgi:glycosyltransferase involved in cell wall biosynthesis